MFRDRRGVSETVGFVLVFSLVMLTVGTVLTVGYAGLQDARDAERINNAERAFDVLANNVEDITARGAPSRGTEIRLAEASIGPGEPVTVNVSGFADGTRQFSTGNDSLGTVVYEADGTRIRYVGGAVTRVQSGGSTLLGDPNFLISDDNVIIPLVELTVQERTIAGSRTVLVRSERELHDVETDQSGIDRLAVNLTTPAAGAWETYFESEGMTCERPDGDDGTRLTCEFEESDGFRVQLIRFTIDVTFD
ncbi:MAG: DUF7289 family protein [Halolamina sp.]